MALDKAGTERNCTEQCSYLTVGDCSAVAASSAVVTVASAPCDAYSRLLRAACATRRIGGGEAGVVNRVNASSSLPFNTKGFQHVRMLIGDTVQGIHADQSEEAPPRSLDKHCSF